MSAFNGAGTFVISGAGLPVVTGTTISSTVENQLNTDLATGLTTCITKDGQSTTTALIPFAVGLKSDILSPFTTNGLISVTAGLKTDILAPYTANGPVALTAGQLGFPAVQNPSADPNTLDDYEEGALTPTVGGTATYTAQTGTYVKVGRLVTFRLSLTINSIGTGLTNGISGLPFAAAAGVTSAAIGFFSGLTTPVAFLSAYVSGTSIVLTGTTVAAVSITDSISVLGNGARVEISGSYQV